MLHVCHLSMYLKSQNESIMCQNCSSMCVLLVATLCTNIVCQNCSSMCILLVATLCKNIVCQNCSSMCVLLVVTLCSMYKYCVSEL